MSGVAVNTLCYTILKLKKRGKKRITVFVQHIATYIHLLQKTSSHSSVAIISLWKAADTGNTVNQELFILALLTLDYIHDLGKEERNITIL